jgi:putative Mn2+ efflux pump MntP
MEEQMSFFEILLIAVSLSMDALAVSIGNGITLKRPTTGQALKTGMFFGVFQAVMPLIGWGLGSGVIGDKIESIDHWVAFILLAAIGAKMIWDVRKENEPRKAQQQEQIQVQEVATGGSAQQFSTKLLLVQAIATSIDALVIGISFAIIKSDIILPVTVIGITTFALSVAGVIAGGKIGNFMKKGAELVGGLVLMAIGARILIEHLFFIT